MSAAAYEVHDLQHVTGLKLGAGVLGPGHDFTVPFHGHGALGQAQGFDQAAYRGARGDLVGVAVDGDLHG